MEDTTYKVIRFYSDHRDKEIIKTGLTRDEAREHCNDADTQGELDDGTKWFDGFEQE